MRTNKNISVIIITLNEEKRVGNLLDDLSKQVFRDFEVIVVDSNSDDNTCEVAKTYEGKLPNLQVHNMKSRGVSLGRNTGVNLANNERLLFLDADVRLERDFLARAVTKLDQSGLEVAGVYMNANGLPFHYKLGYMAFNAGMYVTQFFFPTAVGACIFSTKEAHKKIDGFDEKITLCEDCDYVKKASRTWRFRFLPISFSFDPRRLEQDGFFKMGFTYLKANIRRFFCGEMRNGEIKYPFNHYKVQTAQI